MLRPLALLSGLVLSGCLLGTTDDDDGDTGQDDGDAPQCMWASDDPRAYNPDNLDCEWVGGNCGAQDPDAQPSWASCETDCLHRDETACAAADGCRVTKYALCMISQTCETDYLGCYPTDEEVDPSIACHGASALDCSRNAACWALHVTTFPNGKQHAPSLSPATSTAFQMCIPAFTSPGSCVPATCERVAPDCPPGTTPGVENDCYTDACIPDDLCDGTLGN